MGVRCLDLERSPNPGGHPLVIPALAGIQKATCGESAAPSTGDLLPRGPATPVLAFLCPLLASHGAERFSLPSTLPLPLLFSLGHCD